MRLAKLPFDRKCHRYKFRFAKSIHEFCAWVKEVNGQQATTRYFYVCTRDEKSTAQRMLTTHSGACAGNRVYAFSDFVRGLGKCVAWPPKSWPWDEAVVFQQASRISKLGNRRSRTIWVVIPAHGSSATAFSNWLLQRKNMQIPKEKTPSFWMAVSR